LPRPEIEDTNLLAAYRIAAEPHVRRLPAARRTRGAITRPTVRAELFQAF
jgi:hypothetical protein